MIIWADMLASRPSSLSGLGRLLVYAAEGRDVRLIRSICASADFDHISVLLVLENTVSLSTRHTTDIEQLGSVDHVVVCTKNGEHCQLMV